MPRMYAVTFDNVSVSAAQDFFEISPADDKPVLIHGITLSNVGGTADAGDAQEEFWRIEIRRGHTSSGSGGTAPTPAALNPGDSAAGFSAEVNNTTIASAGTTTVLLADGMNVRIPYVWIPTPELRPIATQGNTTIVVRLLSTPSDAVSMSGTLYVEEI